MSLALPFFGSFDLMPLNWPLSVELQNITIAITVDGPESLGC